MREIADEMRMPYEELLALLDLRDGAETTSLNAPLSEEDARELEMRFIHRMGQRETARELGVSQMQVSRMERRVLSRLRETAEDWRAPR